MGWRVELTPAAARQLRRLKAVELAGLRGVILALADDRRPTGARKLAGTHLWRIRVRVDGDPWRVIYEVRTRERLVVVARVPSAFADPDVGSPARDGEGVAHHDQPIIGRRERGDLSARHVFGIG